MNLIELDNDPNLLCFSFDFNIKNLMNCYEKKTKQQKIYDLFLEEYKNETLVISSLDTLFSSMCRQFGHLDPISFTYVYKLVDKNTIRMTMIIARIVDKSCVFDSREEKAEFISSLTSLQIRTINQIVTGLKGSNFLKLLNDTIDSQVMPEFEEKINTIITEIKNKEKPDMPVGVIIEELLLHFFGNKAINIESNILYKKLLEALEGTNEDSNK